MSGSTGKHEVLAIRSLRLPPTLIAELEAVGRENDRSLSYIARVALREWLDRSGEPDDSYKAAGARGAVVDSVQAHAPESSP